MNESLQQRIQLLEDKNKELQSRTTNDSSGRMFGCVASILHFYVPLWLSFTVLVYFKYVLLYCSGIYWRYKQTKPQDGLTWNRGTLSGSWF